MAVICQSLKAFATLGNRVKATTHLTSQFFGSIQMRMSQQPKQTFFRCYWQEIIRAHPDPHEPKRQKFEDPGLAAIRSARAQNSEGLLRRRSKYLRYEKPWMERKRLKGDKIYKAKNKRVNELKMYVKFVQDYKDTKDD